MEDLDLPVGVSDMLIREEFDTPHSRSPKVPTS